MERLPDYEAILQLCDFSACPPSQLGDVGGTNMQQLFVPEEALAAAAAHTENK